MGTFEWSFTIVRTLVYCQGSSNGERLAAPREVAYIRFCDTISTCNHLTIEMQTHFRAYAAAYAVAKLLPLRSSARTPYTGTVDDLGFC